MFRKKLLLYAMAAVVVFGLVYITETRDLIWPLVNLFTPGRSVLRIYLLAVYLFLLLGVLLFRKKDKIFPNSRIKNLRIILISLFVFGFILNISALLFVTARLDLPTRFFITFSNGEISSNQLLHSHIFKGSVGVIAEYFHNGYFENSDLGIALTGLLPTWFFWFVSVLILATILTTVAYYLFFDSTLAENRRKQIVFFIVYSIFSFSLLVHFVDGGLLSDSTMLTFGLFLAFILRDKKYSRIIEYTSYILWPISAIFLYYYGHFLSSADLLEYLCKGLTIIMIFVAGKYWTRSEINYRLGLMLIILAASPALLPLYNDYSTTYGYISQKISASEPSLVAVYTPINTTGYKLFESVGNLHFYKTTPQIKEKNVGEVLKKFDLLYDLYPVTVPWNTCVPSAAPIHYKFQLTSQNILSKTAANSDLYSYNSHELPSSNGLFRYTVDLYTDPCLPRALNVIDELFKKDLKTFFVYDITNL